MKKHPRKQNRWFLFAVICAALILIVSCNLTQTEEAPRATLSGPPTSADSVEATDPLQEGARRAEAARAQWTDRLPALRGPLAEPVAAPQVVEVPEQTTVDQVVIQFAADATTEQRDEYIASIGGQVSEQIDALNTVIVEVPAINIDQPLPENPIVEQSEPDYFITALEADTISVPSSDPRYAEQWSLEVIGAPEAWSELPADAATVVIAIIDSGICADHPDLQGRILDGWDYIDNDAVPQDEMGHGCGVAGIIAASIDNGEGIAGIAPNARLLPLRVLDANGLGRYSDVAAAVVRATDAGAAIINLSVGGPYPSSILEEAVNYASAHGVMVIAAAGNNGADSVYYPAAYSSVIAVGAVNADLQPTGFSNHGAEIDVWAPGQDILTTRRDGAYGIASGTSYAAPQVAAVAALEMAFGKQLTLGGIVSTSAKAAQAGAGAGAATITPTAIASATIQPTPTASPEPLQLFAPSTSAQASATSASNQLGVVRTRNVDINFAALPDNFNAPAAQQAERDTVLFNLFDDVTLTADNVRLQPRITSSDGFTWIGQIEGDPYSEVVLVVGDGTIEGHVRTQSTLYQITSLGNGVHAVNQIDESAFRMGADDARPANITNPSAPIEASAADTAGFVDILVVFTPAARNAEGGLTEMLSAIEASVVTTNQSYANSGVTQRLRLVHAAEVGYSEAGDIDTDLDNLTDGLIGGVYSLREDYDADVVTFITAGFQGGVCGLGWLMTQESPDFAPFAYNVIRQPCMPGGITFAHELGHNMGLDHDLNNGGGDGVFAYSNGYQDTAGLFHTIMAYSFNGPCASFCPSINRWSNPNQSFNGRPLGVAATADERRSLNETADTVANFRENGAEVCYTLTTAVSPVGTGNLAISPASNCSGGRYLDGTVVSVLVTPNAGNRLDNWTGTNVFDPNANPVTITMTANQTVTANIVPGTTTDNDDFYNALLISPLPFQDVRDTTSATTAVDDPVFTNSACGAEISHTVWYRFVGTGATIDFATYGTNYDTIIGIYTGTRGSLTEVACNDEAASNTHHLSRVLLNTTAGTTYYIMVSGYFDQSGILSFIVAPLDTCNFTVPAGNEAAFVTAINNANSNADASNICISGQYDFASTASGQNALPPITTNILITGTGFDQTVIQRSSAGGVPIMRLFTVNNGGSLSLYNIILRNALLQAAATEGGTILNNGTLAMLNVFIDHTQAERGGAIANYGSLTINSSSIEQAITFGGSTSSMGGAIYNAGTATILATNFGSNLAYRGGAIFNASTGTITIRSSALYLNQGIGDAGAVLYNQSLGTAGGSMTLVDVEITDTVSSNPVIFNGSTNGADTGDATLNIENSVFFNNGGSIDNYSTLTVETSLLDSTQVNAAMVNRSGATADITDTLFINNYNRALVNQGTVTLDNVDFYLNGGDASNGGAILNTGSINGSNGTEFVSNASVAGGGAISSIGNLTFTDTLFQNNYVFETTQDGFGGGAISISGGTTTITNSTFLDNQVLFNTAPSGSGGAIDRFNSGSITVSSSCFANNRAELGADIANSGAPAINAANNWWGSPSGPHGAVNSFNGSVSSHVTTSPFLTSAPDQCPDALPTPTPTFTPSNTPTGSNTPTPSQTSTPSVTPTPSNTPIATDIIFSDGFESGDLNAWSSVNGAPDITVQNSAFIIGQRGLQIVINDNTPTYLTDASPNAEPRYRARFYFDPNSIPMTDGNNHEIFQAFSGSGTSTQVVSIEFRRSAGQYQIRASLVNDGTGWSFVGGGSSSWYTITDAAHYLEIDWRKSSASGANNGGMTLWIDNVQQGNVSNVDNDTRRVDTIRLGAVTSIDSGTSGTYFFDEFESREFTFIGPAIVAPPPSSPTPTATATRTSTATPSQTATASSTVTPSNTPSATATPSQTVTPTVTQTPSESLTPSQTATPSETATPSNTPTPSQTATPSHTPSSTPSRTNTSTATRTSTSTSTITPSQTVTASNTPTVTSTPDVTDRIFMDGFESGNLNAWSSVNGSPDISVQTSALIIGTRGLQIVINDNTPTYLTDNTPNAELRYRARFYFDPNSIPMVDNNNHEIFQAFSGSGTSTQVISIEFRFDEDDGYQIRPSLRTDGTSFILGNWFTLTDASHFIEFDWRARVGSTLGGMTLWIDGVQQQNITGVDNDTRRVDTVRLGAVASIDNGTRGTYFFDEFESRELTYIGPAASGPAPSSPTPTATASRTSTVTPSQTLTPSPTSTSTLVPIPSLTPTVSSTPSRTNTPTESATPSQTATASQTATTSSTPSRTNTATATNTPSPTSTASRTNTATATRTPSATPSGPSDLIFADGFESGNLSAWSSVNGAPDISVQPGAALVESQGMQIVINDNTATYLTDNSPNAETRYRARFYFDPNSIPMDDGNNHEIFQAYSGAGTTTQVISLEFRRNPGLYQIRPSVRTDGTSFVLGGWFTISDAAHFLEIDWRRSTGGTNGGGGMTFWIDGVQQQDITGVDNDTRRVDMVRLGAITSIDTGTNGTYFFDAFESRRTNFIGALINERLNAAAFIVQPSPAAQIQAPQVSPTSLPTATLAPVEVVPTATFTEIILPTATLTLPPPPTNTEVPPTETPVPPPTNTEVPPPTETPVPPPTDEPEQAQPPDEPEAPPAKRLG